MDETPIARACPQCGQPLAPGAESCAACGRDEANPFISPAAPLDQPAPRGFSLQLLFAVVTVICISLAVGVLLPGLGVILGLVFVPAVIRASVAIKRKQEAGRLKDRDSELVAAFFASAGITFVVWLASAVAFTIVCFPLGLVAIGVNNGRNSMATVVEFCAFGLGGLAGLIVFFWLMKRRWPQPAERDATTAWVGCRPYPSRPSQPPPAESDDATA